MASTSTAPLLAPAAADEADEVAAAGDEEGTKAAKALYEKSANEVRQFEQSVLSALKSDVDTLAKEFCSADSEDLSLERFGQLFNEMEFSTIFLGHLASSLVNFCPNFAKSTS